MGMSQKETVEDLKIRWKRLWRERADDKVRAEGIATADYGDLFVEKGTVICATRNFKALDFKEILDKHHIANADRYIPPNPQIGGWTKFVKLNITNQSPKKKKRVEFSRKKMKHERQRPKKGGRGWLHKR